jgi:hypothetical protein
VVAVTAPTLDAPITLVSEPGVYEMPADVYHSDPVPGGSLSSSEARKLLPPSCPALFRHYKDHPEERVTSKALDFGSAAHAIVLEGDESAIVEVDYADYRKKDAQAQRDAAHAAGRIPLLPPELRRVREMAAALRAHPVAAKLLASGQPERSLFWADGKTGVRCRARLDWQRDARAGRRVIIPDYKTAKSAEPRAFARAAVDHSYHVQAAWYLNAVRALGLAGDDAAFVFIVQEKTPPYLVTVCELDADALALGHALARAAIDTYLRCSESGRWPGYRNDEDIAYISLPPWAADQLEDVPHE